jgi:hypothetical protein
MQKGTQETNIRHPYLHSNCGQNLKGRFYFCCSTEELSLKSVFKNELSQEEVLGSSNLYD